MALIICYNHGALNSSVLDALDIIIAAFLLFQIYRLLKGTAAIRILLGMEAIYLLYRLVQLLEMRLLSEFLGSFMGLIDHIDYRIPTRNQKISS